MITKGDIIKKFEKSFLKGEGEIHLPETYLKVKFLVENKPALSVGEISKILGISKGYVSQILTLLFPKGKIDDYDLEGVSLAKRMIRAKNYKLAVSLLEVLNIPFDERFILLRIPENYLSPPLMLLRIDYNFKTSNDIDAYIKSLENFIELNPNPLYMYSALYQLLNGYIAKMEMLKAKGIIDFVFSTYDSLPYELSLNFSALIGRFSLIIGDKQTFTKILSKTRTKIKVYKSLIPLRKKVLMDLLMMDGRFREANQMSFKGLNINDETLFKCYIFLNLGMYRDVININLEPVEFPMYKYYCIVCKGFARLMLGYHNNALNSVNKVYGKYKSLPNANLIFWKFMALYYSLLKNNTYVKEYLKKMEKMPDYMGRVSRALLTDNPEHLSAFRREMVLKYLMERKFSKAKNMAIKNGIIFEYEFYKSLLTALGKKFPE